MNARSMYVTVQQGDRDQLVAGNADLVKRIAFHLLNRLPPTVQAEDLIQAGMVGLLEAARQYDASQGASFETYAGIRIRGAMLDEVRRNDWAPRSVHRRHREVAEAIREIEAETGREAKDTEICARLGIEMDEYHRILADSSGTQLFSLDHGGENGNETWDVADGRGGPGDELSEEHFSRDLVVAIEKLPERERLVMSLYYVDEMNQREIGAVLGVSESRICQIHNKAILRLKGLMKDWH